MKRCTQCKIEKPESDYFKDKCLKSGLRSEWKECSKSHDRSAYHKQWRDKNRAHLREYMKVVSKRYRDKHKEQRHAGYKAWYGKNKQHLVDYQRIMKQENAFLRMRYNLGSRTATAFKAISISKPTKTENLLGTSYKVVRAHIENQFTEGMTWENYGKWHIDHIIPLGSAKDLDELVALCHYSNLQPLWAADNLAKGDKMNWKLEVNEDLFKN